MSFQHATSTVGLGHSICNREVAGSISDRSSLLRNYIRQVMLMLPTTKQYNLMPDK